jgi:hypothetical protein
MTGSTMDDNLQLKSNDSEPWLGTAVDRILDIRQEISELENENGNDKPGWLLIHGQAWRDVAGRERVDVHGFGETQIKKNKARTDKTARQQLNRTDCRRSGQRNKS